MSQAKYTGAPMGGGNPPGEHTDSYLADPGKGASNFVKNPSYRSGLHVGINETSTMVGNQPKDTSEGTINWSKKPALR